jgi:hypothetical protein
MECGDLSPLFLTQYKSADRSAHSKAHSKSKIIVNVQLVRFEAIDSLDH